MLDFRPLEPSDLFEIECQPSQALTLGIVAAMTQEAAWDMCDQRVAWAARQAKGPNAGRLIACFGILEQFEGCHGAGWSMLAPSLGAAHLPLTRFMRRAIAGCGLARVELIARALDMETLVEIYPDLDAGQLVELAMFKPTPEMRWAVLLGMKPAHVLRCFGAAAETHMLFERIAPPKELTANASISAPFQPISQLEEIG